MKPLPAILALAGLFVALSASAADPAAGLLTNPPPAPPVALTNAPVAAPEAPAAVPPAPPATNAAVPPIVTEHTTNGLRMNFRGAPLNLVLDYLVDAAGFIINKRPDVRGTVEISSSGPVTKDEAVELLNTNLKANGYAVNRNGRILNIFPLDTAKTANTPIQHGNNPDDVQESDEVVTQIIPIRYANVSQLVANLEILLPTSATLSANESANSLIMVAAKTDIKRMLRIIDALDTSIANVSSIRVIPLRYADAKDTATLITQLFAPQTSNQGGGGGGRGNLFNMFGGGGFGRGGGFGGGLGGGFGGNGGGGGGGGRGNTAANGAAATRVVAVADDRSNSVIVSAPADLLSTIAEMVDKIDQAVTDVSELRVFRLLNADPAETADQLTQLFPDDSASAAASQNNVPFFFRGGGFGRGGGANAATPTGTSDRMKKMGRVLAVPDPRTGSLIVTASKSLMPQIAEMVAELDSNKGRKEMVGYYELVNADPQDVYQNLQDLFNRVSVRMNTVNSRSMLGSANPLTTRETSTQNATSGTTPSALGGGTGRSGGMNTGF